MNSPFKNPDSSRSRHYEWQYLDLMRAIWEGGSERVDRTGVGTRSVFGAALRFDLSDGQMPLMTTKRVYWKTATREMLWFLTGGTNIRELLAQGVTIWSDWPLARYRKVTQDEISQEAFEKRIVEDVDFAERWGDLGPVYGKQWVDWPTYLPAENGLFRRGEGVDQITQLVESLKNNPGSRRHIIEGWNVAELDQMALPPCHKTYQFHVADGKLNGLLFQRSCDVALGLPFNLWSAALLQRMLAAQAGLEPGEFVWMGGDVHLYLNHEALVKEQLSREPAGSPRLHLKRQPASIFDYRIEDFEVTGYEPKGAIKAPIAV